MSFLDVVYTPNWTDEYVWIVAVGFVVAFFLAFGMGANDCANSYGTVVGAGVLKLWQAYLLASVFELLGAALLGYKVADTIRKGIVDVNVYNIEVYHQDKAGKLSWVVAGDNASCECNATCNPFLVDNSTCTIYTKAPFMVGELGALTGTAFWLIAASVFKMPVSATQSVVGATVGFSLVLNGLEVPLPNVAVLSWIASPLLAGAFSVLFYLIIKVFVFESADQLSAALHVLPLFLWFTLIVNLFTVFYRGSKYIGLQDVNWWQALLISYAVGVHVALFFWVFGNKWIRARVIKRHKHEQEQRELELRAHSGSNASARRSSYGTVDEPNANTSLPDERPTTPTTNVVAPEEMLPSIDEPSEPVKERPLLQRLRHIRDPVKEDDLAVMVFDLLQIVSASFLAFSHGSNDTANSVGPLAGLYLQYELGRADADLAPDDYSLELIIIYGAVCMLVGLYVLGHKVIETIGKNITDVNAASGFSMTLGTAFTVLVASKIGIPVSTTHCMVGAVVFVGIARSDTGGVHWGLFRWGSCVIWLIL